MQKPTLQKLIDTKFDKLPKEVSVLFNSEENADTISTIAQENGLTEEQELSLFDEIAYVFFGVTPISEFKSEIKNTLAIDEKTALSISSEVYGSVFLPIKKFLVETPSDIDSVNQGLYGQGRTQEPINHQDILNEIENPTPSIQVAPMAPTTSTGGASSQTSSTSNTLDLDIDTLEIIGKSIGKNSPSGSSESAQTTTDTVATPINTTNKAPTPVNASVPVLSGFKPISNDTHPAQNTANKLNSVLDSKTQTPVREVYQSKGHDPYHEPIE